MKEQLNQAKQEMKTAMRPYQIYGYYLAIPIFQLLLLLLGIIGIDFPSNNVGTILFIFTILANIGVRKLSDIPKRKYVAPIIMYIANSLGILILISVFSYTYNLEAMFMFIGFISIVVIILEIVASVFFFLTARDIKKAYPTMKEDSKEGREKYLLLKKQYKEERKSGKLN